MTGSRPLDGKVGSGLVRRGARVVDWDGLENRSRRKSTVGSNPTPSAPFPSRVKAVAVRGTGLWVAQGERERCDGPARTIGEACRS